MRYKMNATQETNGVRLEHFLDVSFLRCASIATDVPLTGLSDAASAAPLQTKLTPYTSYVIGATLPGKVAPEASFRDTSEPCYYLRIDRRRRGYYAVFGGLDHKTGQVEQTDGLFDELEATLHGFLPDAKIDRRWSGQVTESHDGLPLIGETARRQYVATGFSGNGITFGTLSAMMICDALKGQKNPWRELFDPQRTQVRDRNGHRANGVNAVAESHWLSRLCV